MEGESWFEKNKSIIVFIGIFVVLVIIGLLVFFGFRMISRQGSPSQSEEKEFSENNPAIVEEEKKETGALPTGNDKDYATNDGKGVFSDWEVEKYGFGDFYTVPDMDVEIGFSDIALPINVKVDVSNYHDINRQLDLETGIDSLNNNGFAVFSNPFAQEADDFYALYDYFNKKQLPVLVTADFLFYYYQNTLKAVYKEIEGTTFYENFWETNLKLFSIAKIRYEEHKEQAGITNDPSLEAERLELAFFATALSLLQPQENQINRESTLEATEKFSIGEANYYSLQIPSYLKDNVDREVELIRGGEGIYKSPVLLYERDYAYFKVPEEYLSSSRLNNFYLSSHWLNSVFPLYYRSEECSGCLLDKDDWRINFYAAILLAEDFSGNQDLQNDWAKIYKLMSFFSGLRDDLTYLHYHQAFNDIFGDSRLATEIFSSSEEDIDDKLLEMQTRLAEYAFLGIEGAINKLATSTRPFLGMKMLTESYWPNDYLTEKFTGPEVGIYLDAERERDVNSNLVKTFCQKDRLLLRCNFSAYDVVNLIYPVGDINGYFAANARYENYDIRVADLKSQLMDFSPSNWHSSNYWSILDISKKFLNQMEEYSPSYAKNSAWIKRKLDTVIGAWANLQVEVDTLASYQGRGVSGLNNLNGGNESNKYSYIEPDYTLASELLANTNMLLRMLSILGIAEKDNEAVSKLTDLKKDLESVVAIVVKELAGEELLEEDRKFIATFPLRYLVKKQGNKELVLSSQYSRRPLIDSVKGVKILVLAYQTDGKNVFAVGPIFNFWEYRQ